MAETVHVADLVHAYNENVLKQLSVKVAPITSRAADFAPVAPACCNVCRTCTTTNVVGLVFGAAAAIGTAATRFFRSA